MGMCDVSETPVGTVNNIYQSSASQSCLLALSRADIVNRAYLTGTVNNIYILVRLKVVRW
ncbi:hypothetical protein BaRGS_00032729, partial [Batillaria attramentaria]